MRLYAGAFRGNRRVLSFDASSRGLAKASNTRLVASDAKADGSGAAAVRVCVGEKTQNQAALGSTFSELSVSRA